MFKNWITSIVGLIAASPLVAEGFQKHDLKIILCGIGIAVLGFVAKDHNKT